jgi:starch synthase
MPKKLRIAFIASECDPLVKTGGLADVIGSLPYALKSLGHDPFIVIPLYSGVNLGSLNMHTPLSSMGVWMGNCLEWCAVHMVVKDEIPIYLVEYNKYFARSGLYNDHTFRDYADNPFRFGFFTRAALQLMIDLGLRTDILHVHDWQTALGSAYQKIWHWNHPCIGNAASVLTIHNLAYQGVFSSDCFDYLGLQWKNFTSGKFEDHGRVNFLKGGIQYADRVTTVSSRYADEIRMPGRGHGLAPYLSDKADRFEGIMNGVDYSVWNPETDPLIPARYSVDNLEGKVVCKRCLQQRMGLSVDPGIPLLGIVSRFTTQKGLELLVPIIQNIFREMKCQLVILGAGDPSLEIFFSSLPGQFPKQAASYIGYDNELAHWIEAGSDCFIMPSLYEPCGLNQIYSLKYGTLPLVRATGGLDESVEQYNEKTVSGSGFKFYESSAKALFNTIGWVVSTWYDRREHFRAMQRYAMTRDFSWNKSAEAYSRLYHRTIIDKSTQH